jgi:hypothetical protein
MNTQSDISSTYARAFAVRKRMIEFRADLSGQQSWRMASGILFERFELAFGFFLDAPTPDRLARIIGFESEMSDIAGRLPDMRRAQRDGTWSH